MRGFKALILLVAGLVCCAPLWAQQTNADTSLVKVKFLDSYAVALQEAAATHKPIFFDCYADWAVPCHGMDKYVFSDADFAKWLNEHFVCLRLNMTLRENQPLVQKYNVRFYAHFLILDAEGNMLHRIVGGKKLPEFKEQVARGLEPQRTLAGMNKRFEAGERGIDFLRDYAEVLGNADEGEKQMEIIKSLVSQLDTIDLVKKENWDVFKKMVEDIHSDYYRYLLTHYDAFVSENGKERVTQVISYQNILALYPYLFNDDGYENLDVAGIEATMNRYLEPGNGAFAYLKIAKARGEGRIVDVIALLKEEGNQFPSEILRTIDVNLVSVIKKRPELKDIIVKYLQERMVQYESPSIVQEYKDALAEIGNIGKGVKFVEGTFNEVLTLAKQEDKLIFMDCYTSWCGPCKILAKKIFPLENVGKFFNEHFVNVQVDMEKGEGKDLAKRYEVKAFPTLLVLDAEGNLVHRVMGVRPPQQLIAQMKRALSEETAYAPVKAKYDAGDRSPRTMTEYLLNMSASGEMDSNQTEQAAAEYFAGLSEKEKLNGEMVVFLLQFATDVTSEAAQYFLAHEKKYKKLTSKDVALEASFNNYKNLLEHL